MSESPRPVDRCSLSRINSHGDNCPSRHHQDPVKKNFISIKFSGHNRCAKVHIHYVFHQHVYTVSTCQQSIFTISLNKAEKGTPHTFCELCARLRVAKSEFGSTVPRKMDLYWFIPAFVNSRVGSERGTTEEEGTVYGFHGVSNMQIYIYIPEYI